MIFCALRVFRFLLVYSQFEHWEEKGSGGGWEVRRGGGGEMESSMEKVAEKKACNGDKEDVISKWRDLGILLSCL